MRVLAACEFSGIVRDAFRARGHDAWSCDLEPCESDPRWHLREDVRQVVGRGWDLMVAFPPCTYLARSGARWHQGTARQAEAVEFVRELLAAPVPRIAVENPVGALSRFMRRPDLIVHPWEFGHRETKATCLWLKHLPPLMPTEVWAGPYVARVHWEPPGPERWKNRSRTLPGIADAMADQWGSYAQ